MGAGDAGQGVAVGDGERRQAERLGGGQQLLDVAGAAQEGVVGGDLQLDVAEGGRPREARHAAQSLFGWRCPLVDGRAVAGPRIST